MRTSSALLVQFARFAGVGVIGTLTHYAVLVVLVESLLVAETPASAFGFVVGALVNYTLNRRYTFRSSIPHSSGLSRFLIVAATGAALNTLIFYFALTHAGMHYLVAQVIATSLVLIWNFAGNRFWTFAHSGRK
jgi:putative flippase GtrA